MAAALRGDLVGVAPEEGHIHSQQVQARGHCNTMPQTAPQVLSNGSL